MTAKLSEAQLHKFVADYLAVAIPETHPDAFWSTIGHGGGGRVRGAQLKARGVKKGVPDIVVCWWDGERTHTGWIELKATSGRVSEEQEAFLHKAANLGMDNAVCRSLSAVYQTLRLWRVPIKAHLTVEAA